MGYRKFSDLTDAEIKEVVTDIFAAKKVTCIKRHKKADEISCKIYTEWGHETDEDGIITICDELILKNPFSNGRKAIQVDFSIDPKDFLLLKQYCYAHNVSLGEEEYRIENPYIKPSLYNSVKNMSMLELAGFLTGIEQKALDNGKPHSLEEMHSLLKEEK